MGEEFNFPNSDNEDHFWRINSPTSPNSDNFDPYKFDFSGQSIDSMFEPDLNFDHTPGIGFDTPNNQMQLNQDMNASPLAQINSDVNQFLNSDFLTQNSPTNNFTQNDIEEDNQILPNQQFNHFFDQQVSLSNQPNMNLPPSINHPNLNMNLTPSINQLGPHLNMNMGFKGNNPGIIPNTSHRRTPSTPTSIFNLNNFSFQQIPHQTQQPQQPVQKQQAQKLTQLTPAQIQQMQQLLGHDLALPQNRNRKMSSQPLPIVPTITTSADEEFITVCRDPDIKFNPHKLGFIPTKFWPDKEFTFGELVSDFFQRKNNANSRFYHKLYNALKISEDDPFYSVYLGIEWVNNNVLKVDKKKFARLLNIKTIDGSLFHQQGNFPSHGFIELGTNDALKYVSQEDLESVDYENVRLLVHQAGVFVRGCTEDSIEGCKWVSSRKRH